MEFRGLRGVGGKSWRWGVIEKKMIQKWFSEGPLQLGGWGFVTSGGLRGVDKCQTFFEGFPLVFTQFLVTLNPSPPLQKSYSSTETSKNGSKLEILWEDSQCCIMYNEKRQRIASGKGSEQRNWIIYISSPWRSRWRCWLRRRGRAGSGWSWSGRGSRAAAGPTLPQTLRSICHVSSSRLWDEPELDTEEHLSCVKLQTLRWAGACTLYLLFTIYVVSHGHSPHIHTII